jgi:hypothetical protein
MKARDVTCCLRGLRETADKTAIYIYITIPQPSLFQDNVAPERRCQQPTASKANVGKQAQQDEGTRGDINTEEFCFCTEGSY